MLPLLTEKKNRTYNNGAFNWKNVKYIPESSWKYYMSHRKTVKNMQTTFYNKYKLDFVDQCFKKFTYITDI